MVGEETASPAQSPDLRAARPGAWTHAASAARCMLVFHSPGIDSENDGRSPFMGRTGMLNKKTGREVNDCALFKCHLRTPCVSHLAERYANRFARTNSWVQGGVLVTVSRSPQSSKARQWLQAAVARDFYADVASDNGSYWSLLITNYYCEWMG